MTKKMDQEPKSSNLLARTKFGKVINYMLCGTYLWSHWNTIDRYFIDTLLHSDKVLERTLQKSKESGLPVMHVSDNQGKFLQLLTAAVGAKRVLEIGTLGGYSTIWLARGMDHGGRLITLEYDPVFAEIAKGNIHAAGLSKLVEIRLGLARDSLKKMIDEKIKPFDLIFIDADKNNYPQYLTYALKMSHSGTIIIGDNVVPEEELMNKATRNADIVGMRHFIEMLGSDVRVDATAIQTVGSRGHDGFAIARVR